ncbi:MAG: hypothetical protein D6790_04410 [Caldilineae bacterium]|nr:MAG: hypothetical protein D6790_04410 [Caldilineae bacterium]
MSPSSPDSCCHEGGIMKRLLAIASTLLLLASCGGGGSGSGQAAAGSTQVTVSLGGVAAGALQAPGTIPGNVVSALVDALAADGTVIVFPPVTLLAANNFTGTVTVPNGQGIRIRVRALDAAGKQVYEGLSAPQNLIGVPVAVPVILSLTVKVTANPTTVNRGGTVNLSATTAGAAPTPNSPLVWNASGGTFGAPGANGASIVWNAPMIPGAYTIEAHVDPYVNPDQDPNVFGSVAVKVVNRLPIAVADTYSMPSATSALIPVLANDSDPDGDRLTIQALTQPANGTAVIAGAQVRYTPNPGFVGTDHFTYTISDGFGGTATAGVTVFVQDTIPPLPPVINVPGNNSYSNVATLFVSGTAEANALVDVYADGFPAGQATANAAGAWSLTTGALLDGVHVLMAYATDAAGNVSAASAPVTVTVDTLAPAAPVISAPVTNSYSNVATLAVSGRAEVNALVDVYADAAPVGQTTAAAGNWSIITPALGNGPHALTAYATDAAGNVSPASAAVIVTVDTIAPSVTFDPHPPLVTVDPYTLSGTVADNYGVASATVTVDGVGPSPLTLGPAGSFTVTVTGLGPHTVAVTATDFAGNQTTVPDTLSIAAQILYVDPYTGLDTYSGLSWLSPYASLGKAVSVAQPSGTIKVAASNDPTIYSPPLNPYTSVQPPEALLAPVVVNVPNLTISGGWIPATDTQTSNPAVPLSAGPPVSLSVLDAIRVPNGLIVQASGVLVERIFVSGASNAAWVVAGGANPVNLNYMGADNSGVGLDVYGAGTSVNVQNAYFTGTTSGFLAPPPPGYGIHVSQDAYANISNSLIRATAAEGLRVEPGQGVGAKATAVNLRVLSPNILGVFGGGRGVLATGSLATLLDLKDSMVVGSLGHGIVLDTNAGGTLANTQVVESSSCGLSIASASVALTNVLLWRNGVCGLNVVGPQGVANPASFVSILNNAPSAFGPGGGLIVQPGGSVTMDHSIIAYNDQGTPVGTLPDDVYALGTWNPAATVIVRDSSGIDPYALPLRLDRFGGVDQYTSYLPYLSQPTGPLPASPAINAGASPPSLTPVVGMTTDIYGMPDVDVYGNVDLGYHYPSGDLDLDMLPDALENDPYGFAGFQSDSNAWDTDGDGWSDGYEVYFGGSDPANPASTPLNGFIGF